MISYFAYVHFMKSDFIVIHSSCCTEDRAWSHGNFFKVLALIYSVSDEEYFISRPQLWGISLDCQIYVNIVTDCSWKTGKIPLKCAFSLLASRVRLVAKVSTIV